MYNLLISRNSLFRLLLFPKYNILGVSAGGGAERKLVEGEYTSKFYKAIQIHVFIEFVLFPFCTSLFLNIFFFFAIALILHLWLTRFFSLSSLKACRILYTWYFVRTDVCTYSKVL